MKNTEFRQWLCGFFELSPPDAVLVPQQIQMIVNHLNLAEAVEGQLDAVNKEIRMDIDGYRASTGAIDEDRVVLTANLRNRVL